MVDMKNYFNVEDTLPENAFRKSVEDYQRAFFKVFNFNENISKGLRECFEILQHKCFTTHKGLGVVYRMMSLYFEKDRNSIKNKTIPRKKYRKIWFKHKSIKTTLNPIPRKSWKGKRA